MIRKNIESWRTPLIKSFESIVNQKLSSLSKDKYTIEFIKSSLKSSFALENLESEIRNLLNFYAWKTQILYFKIIQASIGKNVPLKNVIFEPVKGLPRELQFFIEDGIDQILEDFQRRIDDQGYQSDENATMNDILIDFVKCENWKDVFKAVTMKLTQKAIDSVFIEKTISIILSYIASLRDANTPPSEAQISFNQEDKNLKQALVEYKSNNQSKRKAQFLMTELHSIISKAINSGDVRPNIGIVRMAIKYGYPLPLSCATLIATAIDQFLTKSELYSAGIFLEITDDDKRVHVQFKTKNGQAKLRMRQFNGSVFLCQSDYRAFVGMADQMYEEVDQAFFYEALTGYLKYLHFKFPRQAETLRDGVLKELELL
jgi:hypothetical protein